MKSIFMKRIFFIIIIASGIISCHSSKNTTSKTIKEKDNKAYLNGSWQLQMLFASDNKWTADPYIDLDLKEKTFTVNSGCNSISGRFTTSESYIAFDKNIVSTKMACAGNTEKAFLAALLKINKYTITNNELELGQGEIVLMKFKRS
jgi:heat shock protein HslJ